MVEVRTEGLTKRFGAVTALHDLTFDFPDGTVTCLLGPSGCGKTTLLRLIAGLEQPTAGSIRIGNRDVTRLPPGRRDLAMVFQYPVMYPTLTVAENLEEPLRHDRRVNPAERQRRVDEALDVLQLRPHAKRRFESLDGGMRQRVAVARAVARHSPVLLFDEPTTNVESHAKLQLIRAFKEVAARLQQTIIYVTHDQTEAMTLADRIALMQDGRILQCASPLTLYANPSTEFGGWFLGSPGMNFLRARPDPATHTLSFALLPTPLESAYAGVEQVALGIRPEHLLVSASTAPDSVPATVTGSSVGIAGRVLLTLKLEDGSIVKAKTPPTHAPEPGAVMHVTCPLEHATLFANGKRLDQLH